MSPEDKEPSVETLGMQVGPAEMGSAGAMLMVMRPSSWIKNGIVLMPVVFAKRYDDPCSWLLAVMAMAAFCAAASASYIMNDIWDAASDRLHPRKRSRPIAVGRLHASVAVAEALLLVATAFGFGMAIGFGFAALVLLYVGLQVCYSLVLKHKVLLDVICLAIGFVLRAVAGAYAIDVVVSPWLIVCTFTIALFMGFCKRYNEIVTLNNKELAGQHRRTLNSYTPELLTHLITLSASVAIVAYLLYATSARTVAAIGSADMVLSLPVVLYGVCRFAMLSMGGRYADPTDILLHDRPLQVSVVLWLALSGFMVSHGAGFSSWLQPQR